MNATKTESIIKPIVQEAWEKDTQNLRTMVIKLWRSKGLKPGYYKTWKMKKKDEQEASTNGSKAKRRASTEVKKKAAKVVNHETTAQVDHTEERSSEEPIALRDTNVDETDGHLPHQSTSQRQKISPAAESSQSRSPKSHGINSPISSTSVSGFSSSRYGQLNFHLDDSSPSRISEQCIEKVHRQLSEKVASEPGEVTDKTVTDKLPDKDSEKKLLPELETLAGKLEEQQKLLANTETVIGQLSQVLNNSTINSDFQAKSRTLNEFYEDLQRKIQAKKAEVERSIQYERQFNDSCQNLLVWIVNEHEGISKKIHVSIDHEILQTIREDSKVVRQRIVAKETDMMELLNKGHDVISRTQDLESRKSKKHLLEAVKSSWNLLVTKSHELQTCVEAYNKYIEAKNSFSQWLDNADEKLESLKLTPVDIIENHLKELSSLSEESRKKLDAFESNTKLGQSMFFCVKKESDALKNKLIIMKERWCKFNNDLLIRKQLFEDSSGLKENLHQFELDMDDLVSRDLCRGLAGNPNFLDRLKEAREKYSSLQSSLNTICQLANKLVPVADEQRIDISNLRNEVKRTTDRFTCLSDQFNKRCDVFLEIFNFKKKLQEPIPSVATEQEEGVKPMMSLLQIACSSKEFINLVSSSEDEDFTTDASKIDGLKQKSNEKSLEKKDYNIDSDSSEDNVNSVGKRKTKISRQNVNRLVSTTPDSEPGCYEKIEKKKDSNKRTKDSDPDWNSLSDTDINSDGSSSLRFHFKKKYKGKTRSLVFTKE